MRKARTETGELATHVEIVALAELDRVGERDDLGLGEVNVGTVDSSGVERESTGGGRLEVVRTLGEVGVDGRETVLGIFDDGVGEVLDRLGGLEGAVGQGDFGNIGDGVARDGESILGRSGEEGGSRSDA